MGGGKALSGFVGNIRFMKRQDSGIGVLSLSQFSSINVQRLYEDLTSDMIVLLSPSLNKLYIYIIHKFVVFI